MSGHCWYKFEIVDEGCPLRPQKHVVAGVCLGVIWNSWWTNIRWTSWYMEISHNRGDWIPPLLEGSDLTCMAMCCLFASSSGPLLAINGVKAPINGVAGVMDPVSGVKSLHITGRGHFVVAPVQPLYNDINPIWQGPCARRAVPRAVHRGPLASHMCRPLWPSVGLCRGTQWDGATRV